MTHEQNENELAVTRLAKIMKRLRIKDASVGNIHLTLSDKAWERANKKQPVLEENDDKPSADQQLQKKLKAQGWDIDLETYGLIKTEKDNSQ